MRHRGIGITVARSAFDVDAALLRGPMDPGQAAATETPALQVGCRPDDPGRRHGSEESAVEGDAAVVSHQEPVPSGNRDRVGKVALGTAATSADVETALVDEPV
jgi:hypothetical protein